jgi:hypothetical protein
MLFPRYLFITYFWWSEGWWLEAASNCTVDEVIAATDRTIAVGYFPEALREDRDNPTDVGSVSQ